MEILKVLDVWQLFGGLGMFLFGMFLLESGIKKLSDRTLKKMIRGATARRTTSIATGTVAAIIVQSSSAVSLLVLAFVGAGYLSTLNAFGVIMGSNLGTTFTSWIVALVGFKLDIEAIALPFLTMGGLLYIVKGSNKIITQLGKFFAGLGLLFLGIAFMKASVDGVADAIDLSQIPHYGDAFYVGLGTIITAAMQASAAVIALVLTAVNADIISLEEGAAMVIGSNIGTTITVILGAIGGGYAKRRVALSHLVFNVLTALIAILLLPYMLVFITDILGFGNNAVVAIAVFHTLFNILGILIFFPLMKRWSAFLEASIKGKKRQIGSIFLKDATPEVIETALETIKREALHLLMESWLYNAIAFRIEESDIYPRQTEYGPLLGLRLSQKERYQSIKKLGDDIFAFAARARNQELEAEETLMLDKYLHAVRSFINAAKNLKDIQKNLGMLRNSNNIKLKNAYRWSRDNLLTFVTNIKSLILASDKDEVQDMLIELRQEVEALDQKFVQDELEALAAEEITKNVISDALMANRYYCNAFRITLDGLSELLLEVWADDRDLLPDELVEPGD
jgi:phosphate:Na+ symporter